MLLNKNTTSARHSKLLKSLNIGNGTAEFNPFTYSTILNPPYNSIYLGDSLGAISFQKDFGYDPVYPYPATPQNITLLDSAASGLAYSSSLSGVRFLLPALPYSDPISDPYYLTASTTAVDPTSGDPTKFLNQVGDWVVNGIGGGDVSSNISSSIVGQVALFADTTGKLISNSTASTADLSANIINISTLSGIGGIGITSTNNLIMYSTTGQVDIESQTGAAYFRGSNATVIENQDSGNLNILNNGAGGGQLLIQNNSGGQLRLETTNLNDISIVSNAVTTIIAESQMALQANTSNISVNAVAGSISLTASNSTFEATCLNDALIQSTNGIAKLISQNSNALVQSGANSIVISETGMTLQNNTSGDLSIINLAGNIQNTCNVGNYYVSCSNTGAQISINADNNVICQSNNSNVMLYGNDVANSKCVEFYYGMSLVANVDSTGNFVTVSSKKYKNPISDLPNCLAELLKLKPVLYTYKHDKSNKKCSGLFLEDLPKDRFTFAKENGIAYSETTPYIIKAIQELYDITQNKSAGKQSVLQTGSTLPNSLNIQVNLLQEKVKEQEGQIGQLKQDVEMLIKKLTVLTKKIVKKGASKNKDVTKSMMKDDSDDDGILLI